MTTLSLSCAAMHSSSCWPAQQQCRPLSQCCLCTCPGLWPGGHDPRRALRMRATTLFCKLRFALLAAGRILLRHPCDLIAAATMSVTARGDVQPARPAAAPLDLRRGPRRRRQRMFRHGSAAGPAAADAGPRNGTSAVAEPVRAHDPQQRRVHRVRGPSAGQRLAGGKS